MYGILVAEQGSYENNGVDAYQIVAECFNRDEARELARNYVTKCVKAGALRPDRFIIHRRDDKGLYTKREALPLVGIGMLGKQ